MTEQTPQDEAREEEQHRPEPRDTAYWARYVETLKVAGVAERWSSSLREEETVCSP